MRQPVILPGVPAGGCVAIEYEIDCIISMVGLVNVANRPSIDR